MPTANQLKDNIVYAAGAVIMIYDGSSSSNPHIRERFEVLAQALKALLGDGWEQEVRARTDNPQ